MHLSQVQQLLRLQIQRRGSIRKWCALHGVNNSHVSEFLAGKRLPGDDVLAALGLEWQVVPKQASVEYAHG